MPVYYLVRYGEADYSEMMKKGFFCFGSAFAPLFEEEEQEAGITAKDVDCVVL